MGNFIDLILSNIFLFIIVISGIIGLLSKNREEQKKQQQKRTQPGQQRSVPQNQSPTPVRTSSSSPERTRRPVRQQKVRRTEMNEEQLEGGSSASIAAEQQAQMESLERRYGVRASNINPDDVSQQDLKFDEPLKALEILSEEQEKLKRNLRNNLKSQGFINGIIMAEVLGKPRSLKPYRSPTLERYNK